MFLQGKNVDAMIIYFGEDPARCSFEQGMVVDFGPHAILVARLVLKALLILLYLLT